METENKDLNTENKTEKSVSEIITETLATEIKAIEDKLEKEITNKFNQLPTVKDETIEVKKDKATLNKEFKEFLTTKATMTTANQPALVPVQFNSFIVGSTGKYGVAKDDAFHQSLDSYKLSIPRCTNSATAQWASEGIAVSGSNITTIPVELPMKALSAKVTIGQEMIRTTGYDLLGFVNMEVEKQILKAEDVQVFNGNSNPFVGIINDPSASVYTQSGSGAFNPTYSDLTSMEALLDPQYRDNACLYMDKTTFGVVKGMKDSNNRPLFEQGYTDNPPTIMGYKYKVLSSGVLPTTAVSGSTAGHIVFGDMKQVHVAENSNGIEVFIDPYSGASTRTTDYYFTKYEALGVAQPEGFVVYKLR